MEYLAVARVFAMHHQIWDVHIYDILQPNNKINKGHFNLELGQFALNFADR